MSGSNVLYASVTLAREQMTSAENTEPCYGSGVQSYLGRYFVSEGNLDQIGRSACSLVLFVHPNTAGSLFNFTDRFRHMPEAFGFRREHMTILGYDRMYDS